MNVLDLARAAGPLLWVILALSLYVVYLAALRAQTLSRLGQDATALIERARAITAESGPQAALADVDHAAHPAPAAGVLRAGLSRAERGTEAAVSAMQSALLAEDARLYAGLSALGTAAQVAPLLGLLGTVIGMVRSFLVFSQTSAPTPAQLATGISEALVNTAAGLIVAIIAYTARNALRAKADRIMVQAERVREDLPGWLSARWQAGTQTAPALGALTPGSLGAAGKPGPLPEVALSFDVATFEGASFEGATR